MHWESGSLLTSRDAEEVGVTCSGEAGPGAVLTKNVHLKNATSWAHLGLQGASTKLVLVSK